jgi:nucleoside-diphosphate-sugar epimerase
VALRVFITGSEGFIGSRVSLLLEAHGIDVIRHIWSEEGDLDTDDISCSPDVIVNCAGRLGGQGFSEDEMMKANAGLPGELAVYCRNTGIRLIHLSTPGVTGLRPDASETDRYDPWGPYETSKVEGEERVRNAGLPPGRLTVLRPDFVFGPGDRHKLPLFRQVSRGWFPLVGRGLARIRPTYVDDVCRAVQASLPDGPLEGEVMNIGGPEVVTVRELAGIIASSLSSRVRFITLPAFLYRIALHLGPLRPPSLSRSRIRLFSEDHFVSISRAASAGFRPSHTLEEATAMTVAWYREQGLL